jgi:hypothetical protein
MRAAASQRTRPRVCRSMTIRRIGCNISTRSGQPRLRVRIVPHINGPAPNAQHQAGVANAISHYESLGYQIFANKATAVDIEGFDSPRIYDFVVRDPNTRNLIGVEVRTTLADTIFLNPIQVLKDLSLVLEGGATVRTSGEPIMGVRYTTYCGNCDQVDIRSTVLHIALKLAKVPQRNIAQQPPSTLAAFRQPIPDCGQRGTGGSCLAAVESIGKSAIRSPTQ